MRRIFWAGAALVVAGALGVYCGADYATRHPTSWFSRWVAGGRTKVKVVCAAVKRQRESLRNPPKTAQELLATLEGHGLPQAVARLRQFADLI